MTRVHLPGDLRARILGEARSPRECCGLLEGTSDGDTFHVLTLHAMENLAGAADRFEMNPRDQIAAQKAARANGHAIVGCYHSHPGGDAEPSTVDLAGAGEENFLWLIAAGEELNAFVYLGGEFLGADWVTSSE
ncbi:MAG TPA: M67 family metallopeptidase [Rhizomicrobium sp.]|jgi:proteasome lid subunit RPN8/RPN11|nr:M67 family metallopeptidase [Rhizomicrobium sp.]